VAQIDEATDDWVPVARVLDAWGLGGWLKLDVFGDTHRSVLSKAKRWRIRPKLADQAIAKEVSVIASRAHGASWVAQIEAVADRDQALAFKGQHIEIRRSDFPRLPRGEYYWVDLIGCSVFNRDHVCLGTVIAMDDHGAHPIMQIEPSQAATHDVGLADHLARADTSATASFYIPFVKHFVDRVNVKVKRIEVDWHADWS
jgi:16S rRNA processing protein RimM